MWLKSISTGLEASQMFTLWPLIEWKMFISRYTNIRFNTPFMCLSYNSLFALVYFHLGSWLYNIRTRKFKNMQYHCSIVTNESTDSPVMCEKCNLVSCVNYLLCWEGYQCTCTPPAHSSNR